MEAAGKTVLPGLIDVHVHLGAPGGVYADPKDYLSPDAMPRALAQYLYSGVTTVKSVGDALDQSIESRDRIARGEILGAELFVSGPMFTAAGGHGTEYAQFLPANIRAPLRPRRPARRKSADEARQSGEGAEGRACRRAEGDSRGWIPGHACSNGSTQAF